MNREFSRMMDSTVHEYEQRLAKYQRDNENMKLTLDQKIQEMTDQSEKQLESQRSFYEERRVADMKTHHILMDEKDSRHKTESMQLSMNFQAKIDKMQIASESKLKTVTSDYETKLRDLRVSTAKDMALKETNQKTEIESLKSSYEAEKSRLVSTYENQLKLAKDRHENQLAQMNEYKRLS